MKTQKSFIELYIPFFKAGLFAIGGGYAMLPPMISELVEKRGWVTKEELLDSYAVAQSIPGVIAINTAALLGYRLAKIKGSIAFVLGAISPSLMIILLIAKFYDLLGDNTWVEGALKGIRIAVLAILLMTVIDLTKKSVKDVKGALLALGAFVVIFFLDVSPILVILVGIVLSGLIYYKKEKHNEHPL